MSSPAKSHKKSNSSKLYVQLGLTTVLFLAELVVGYLINSIALMADALHMLNDVFSLAIAIYCNRLKLNSNKTLVLTYGFQRAEVLGALINSVLLVGLCITILLEAIPRFFSPVEIERPVFLLIVGVVGLLFNVFGMFLFGHSHNHGDQKPHHISKTPKLKAGHLCSNESLNEGEVSGFSSAAEMQQRIIDEGLNLRRETSAGDQEAASPPSKNHEHNINMRGIYLHVLGDALANVAVITTSVVIMIVKSDIKYLVDPLISVLITLLIMKLTIPLIKSASLILLQVVPANISLQNIRNSVLDIKGVYGVHELHVWHLADSKIVASCHVTTDKSHDYMNQAIQIKHTFHSYGIHSVTIQPEYVEKNLEDTKTSSSPSEEGAYTGNTECVLNCKAECNEAQCCPVSDSHK